MEVATSPSQTLTTEPAFPGAALGLCHTKAKDKSGGPDDFEFEPVLHQQYKSSLCSEEQQQQQQHQQQKFMSFADELFHSGYLVPLKLPPRLQTVRSADCSRLSSPAMLYDSMQRRSPFTRCSPKSEGADPFVAALEKVRMEDCDARRGRGSSPGRRARSLSPLRNSNYWFGEEEELSSQETRNQSVNDRQESMKELRTTNLNVSAGTGSRGAKRKVMKSLLSMSRLALRREAQEDGKWRDWIKEVFKATRKKPPMAKWHGPFMCFGHSL